MQEPYRYEKEVEDFLRWSPSVREREGDFGEQPPRCFPPGRKRRSRAAPAADVVTAASVPAPLPVL